MQLAGCRPVRSIKNDLPKALSSAAEQIGAAIDREKKSPDQNIEAFNPSRFITLVS
jgi:hypothetical protein